MWTPIDTEFYAPRHPVDIVAVGESQEALLLRASLESLGAVVHLSLPGTPSDFLKVLARGTRGSPYLIVSCHGDEGGIVFGEYAQSIDTSTLTNGLMPPERIAREADLPGCVVLNTGCFGGEKPMAAAFMRGGLNAYLGAQSPGPHGSAVPVFAMLFFYEVLQHRRSVWDSWRRAASYDAETSRFVLYDERGPHRILEDASQASPDDEAGARGNQGSEAAESTRAVSTTPRGDSPSGE